MAEEIRGANVVIPWCLVSTTLLNGILGFAMLIAILFVTVNIEGVLETSTGVLGFPYMQIFYDATGSLSGASTMVCIVTIMDICAAIAFLATSSRIVFAFGRDRGLTFWRTMSTVSDKYRNKRIMHPYPILTTHVNKRSKQVPPSPYTPS